MKFFKKASVIYNPIAKNDPVFRRVFEASAGCPATLKISALGIFSVYLNGKRLGEEVLTPGWQTHAKRISALTLSIPALKAKNELLIYCHSGWFSGNINYGYRAITEETHRHPIAAIAELEYLDIRGKRSLLCTDERFEVSDSEYLCSDIYDGIVYDARIRRSWHSASVYDFPTDLFCPRDGVPIKEHGRVYPCALITTPKGETVLDFGVNMVGYPVLELTAHRGDVVELSFAEILDSDGNFYNENYRTAKCNYIYTCKEGKQRFSPDGTFYGWRYLRLDRYPHEYRDGEIVGVWVHSALERTGDIKTSNPLLNRLYENVIRGQLGNYVDVPTDCPQRNERLGWTGDAQVFVKAAAYNFNVLEFFRKWLTDMVLAQRSDGTIPIVIPCPAFWGESGSHCAPRSAWSDAITICPTEIYRAYGDKSILALTYDAMKKHLDAIALHSTTQYLWTGCEQYGDWLGLDAAQGSYKGASNDDIISSAFYARSAYLTAYAGKVLGYDTSAEEALYAKIRAKFIDTYEDSLSTQTECAVALHFDLVKDRARIFDRLLELIHSASDTLKTGFVGTPYILHVLSSGGQTELAYKLLLRTEYPSWLYPVTKGATTIWEHWDGIRPDGSLWSKDMNSFNHYAYGACADWMFSVAGGISSDPEYPGYARAIIAPQPSKQLGTFSASYVTPHGKISSSWYYENDKPHYSIETPVDSTIIIDGVTRCLPAGKYVF